jgi:multidrug resistance efflux pump
MKLRVFASASAVMLALASNAQACAVCMGGDDSVMREASNTTLWVLLGLVGFIFLATGATAFFLWRKAMNAPTTSNA